MVRKGTGNPRESVWYSTPNALRRRRGYRVTLSDEARLRLELLAETRGASMSRVVEALVCDAGASDVLDAAMEKQSKAE